MSKRGVAMALLAVPSGHAEENHVQFVARAPRVYKKRACGSVLSVSPHRLLHSMVLAALRITE
ncbi:MAG: hypothetical protein Tsb0020_01070 [Haliangiales bacterium]